MNSLLVFFSKLLHMQPMHASRNKRGRNSRICLQTPWLRCKSSPDFKRQCSLQAVHWLSKFWKRAPLFLATITGVNQFLVFLPYVNFEKVAISSLSCLPNKVEKRINELPELLPSLFKDFMAIKSLHFEIFYYRRQNKAGLSILLEGNLLMVQSFC